MLNELLEIDRGLSQGGIRTTLRHPDLKSLRAGDLLRVHMAEGGRIHSVEPVTAETAALLWTLRDGQHNSFPFVQVKEPLLLMPADDLRVATVGNKRKEVGARLKALLDLCTEAPFNEAAAEWPGAGFIRRQQQRLDQLTALDDQEEAAVPATYARFLAAAGDPGSLLRSLVQHVIDGLRNGTLQDGIGPAAALLVSGNAPLYFDVDPDEFPALAGDPANLDAISRVLEAAPQAARGGRCGVTGDQGPLVDDKFPQPNLPVLGQTYLFARNADAPTNTRYRRTGTRALAVTRATASRLQAAAEAITAPEREGKTWRSIPGERPKESDLLIAYVPGAPDAEPAALIAGNARDAALFGSHAKQIIEAVRGKSLDRKQVELHLSVLRKVDPANRKVVYSNTVSVDRVLAAARRWLAGYDNRPPELMLPVPGKRGEGVQHMPPPFMEPLQLVAFSRPAFIRGGTQRQDLVGWSAGEVIGLFLATPPAARQRAARLLRTVLERRGALLAGVGHALRRGFDSLKTFDRQAALDTVSVLAILLHKLDRSTEAYMNDTAYKLGQLLASADVLHTGYNASERGGSLPPKLIGNAVLGLAQSDPVRALAVLSARWAVYAGWAKRKAGYSLSPQFQNRKRKDIPAADLEKFDREWTIRRGVSQAFGLQSLAAEIQEALREGNGLQVDDRFRAELLLGYMAGPPKWQTGGGDTNIDQDTNQETNA